MKLKHRIRSVFEELKLKARVAAAAASAPWNGDITPTGRLYLTVHRHNGTVEEHGLVSTKVVTDAGVQAFVDALQGTFTISNFKYHGSGTSSTAEDVGNTTLGTEVASRATGSQTEGAAANVYRSVGTIAYSGTFAIVEHGLFSASSAGTLLDRSVFSAINVVNGDSIQFTYDLTLPSGS